MSVYFELGLVLCLTLATTAFIFGIAAGNLALWILKKSQRMHILGRNPNISFWLRLSPFTFAALCTAITIPAFLLFEPRQTSEHTPKFLFLPSALGAALLVVVAIRGLRGLFLSARFKRALSHTAAPFPWASDVPIRSVGAPAYSLAVLGIMRQCIFIGNELSRSLNRGELEAAIAHEMSHVRAHDNLRRVLLNATRVPAILGNLAELDLVWASAAECAADREALRDGNSALDLGSAIITIAKIQTARFPFSGAMSGLVSTSEASAIRIRIEQLRHELQDYPSKDACPRSILRLLTSLLVVAYVGTLPFVLPLAHRFMEKLID